MLLFLLPLAACNAMSGTADLEPTWVDYGENPMENPQFMQDMMAAGTPTDPHKAMADQVGTYHVTGESWMGPGMDPMPMTATVTTRMELDRYLMEDFKSDFMGMPYEGRLVAGYNNLTGEYWSIWFDSLNTGYGAYFGKEIAPGVIEYHGKHHDIMTPDGRMTRMVITETGGGSHKMEMYDSLPEGGEFKNMELNYTKM